MMVTFASSVGKQQALNSFDLCFRTKTIRYDTAWEMFVRGTVTARYLPSMDTDWIAV
jgi:hypothetical protein